MSDYVKDARKYALICVAFGTLALQISWNSQAVRERDDLLRDVEIALEGAERIGPPLGAAWENALTDCRDQKRMAAAKEVHCEGDNNVFKGLEISAAPIPRIDSNIRTYAFIRLTEAVATDVLEEGIVKLTFEFGYSAPGYAAETTRGRLRYVFFDDHQSPLVTATFEDPAAPNALPIPAVDPGTASRDLIYWREANLNPAQTIGIEDLRQAVTDLARRDYNMSVVPGEWREALRAIYQDRLVRDVSLQGVFIRAQQLTIVLPFAVLVLSIPLWQRTRRIVTLSNEDGWIMLGPKGGIDLLLAAVWTILLAIAPLAIVRTLRQSAYSTLVSYSGIAAAIVAELFILSTLDHVWRLNATSAGWVSLLVLARRIRARWRKSTSALVKRRARRSGRA